MNPPPNRIIGWGEIEGINGRVHLERAVLKVKKEFIDKRLIGFREIMSFSEFVIIPIKLKWEMEYNNIGSLKLKSTH